MFIKEIFLQSYKLLIKIEDAYKMTQLLVYNYKALRRNLDSQ